MSESSRSPMPHCQLALDICDACGVSTERMKEMTLTISPNGGAVLTGTYTVVNPDTGEVKSMLKKYTMSVAYQEATSVPFVPIDYSSCENLGIDVLAHDAANGVVGIESIENNYVENVIGTIAE